MPWFRKGEARIAIWLRRRRRLLYELGLGFLAIGLLLDFLGAYLKIRAIEYAGIVLPLVGSVLLLMNYISARGRAIVKKYPEAEDEAAFGSFFYLYLGLCLMTMFLFVPQVLEQIAVRHYSVSVFLPAPIDIVTLTGVPLMAYFVFIAVVLVLSYNAFTKNGFGVFLKIFRGEEVPKECADGNPFFGNVVSSVLWIFLAYLFFSIVYDGLVGAVGVNRVIPDFGAEVWRQIFNFANASVWEEITDRLMVVGLPLLCITYLSRRAKVRTPLRYLLGGNFKIGVVESGVVLFSASLFSLSHVINWDLYKVPPTFVGGLFLGYLFLRYGLYASIMLHFTVDFFTVPLYALHATDVGLPVFGIMLLGFVALVAYSRALVRFVIRDLLGRPISEPPAAPVTTTPLADEYVIDESTLTISRQSNLNGALFSASLCFFVSSAIMLWCYIDVATDPSYGGPGISTLEDLLGWILVMSVPVLSIVMLAVAWKRRDLVTFLVAGVLSGLSFAGPLSVLGEIVLWKAYKKLGLPWRRMVGSEKPPGAELQDTPI
jgi:hypothetical protein